MPEQKKKRGFSFVEIIIAMAIFAIAMLAVIPVLSQAARNMVFAQETAAGYHDAQRLMLVIRDAINDDINTEALAINYVAGRFEYSVWIKGQNENTFSSSNASSADIVVTGINPNISTRISTIIVVVWGDDDIIIGRAIGMTDFCRS